jgi:phospholipase C
MGGFTDAIRRARAIEPAKGTTFLDAKHVVVLMQENRSFDHAFGTLRGVRGFNDPRAIRLHDGSPVWAQPGPDGKRFLPFRLDIKESKTTWMGSLPTAGTTRSTRATAGATTAGSTSNTPATPNTRTCP